MAPKKFSDRESVERSYERIISDVETYRGLGGTALKAVEFGEAVFETRDYQTDVWVALKQVRNEGKDSALIHLATGLGKTTVGVVDALDFAVDFYEREGRPPKIMFAVHQTEILEQAAQRFNEFAPSLAQGTYASGSKDSGNPLTFATMQSLAQNLNSIDPEEFDYILYDEAHHTQAETYRNVVQHFKPKFKVAMTATPDRMDNEDIRELFGKEIYSKTLPDAMAAGYLVDVDYHIVFDDAVKKAMEHGFTARSLNEIRELLKNESRNEQIVAQIEAEKQRLGMEGAKTIVFCQDIEQADDMAALLGGKAYHSGVKAEQGQVLHDFRTNQLQTITTRDMFNEGVDVPDAQLLIFLRSTSSRTVFEQQLGRGLRKHPGKDSVSVLDFVANIERLAQVKSLTDKLTEMDAAKDGNKAERENKLLVHTEHADFDFDKISLSLLEKYFEIQDRKERLRPKTMEEAAELWKENCPGERPTHELVQQKSKEGLFVSTTTINKFGNIKDLRSLLGYNERLRPETMEEAAELWQSVFPDEKPSMRLIAQKSREDEYCSGEVIDRLGGIRELLVKLGYEVRLNLNTMEEAAELWIEICPGENPTRRLIKQMSKEGKFISSYGVENLGGIPALKNAIANLDELTTPKA